MEAFRKALAADAGHVEARIRLGRLLLLEGQLDRAVGELRTALAAADSPILRYFAQLFLGRAYELLAQTEGARQAYEAAVQLFPEAQSPRLALSQIALQAGRRSTAHEILEFLSRSSRSGADPWWNYHHEREPQDVVWLERLHDAFASAAR
jgi:tetratricopeptide (TPR) repeat protein